MKIVAPPKSIHTSEITNDQIIITIPVKKRWLEIIWFLLAFLMGAFAIYSLGKPLITLLLMAAGFYGDVSSANPESVQYGLDSLGLLFFIVFFMLVLPELAVIYILLWRFMGKETISANKDLFVVTRSIATWKSYKAYKTSDISALRIFRPTNLWSADIFSGFRTMLGFSGTIAFDYGAKTFRFADALDEAEARQIIKKYDCICPALCHNLQLMKK